MSRGTTQLETGLFSVCASAAKNKDDILNCCRRSFIKQLQTCLNICNQKKNKSDYEECRYNCHAISRTNDRFCSLVYTDKINCKQDTQDNFMNCCRSDCIPTRDTDCDSYCKHQYLKAIGKNDSPLLKVIEKDPIKKRFKTKKNRVNISYLLVGLLAVITLFFGLVILLYQT